MSSIQAISGSLPFLQSAPVQSPYRTVFGSDELKKEFVKFLQTIFYQLDDQKVLQKMEQILQDPTKTDEEIYNELTDQIDSMRKRLPALFHQLKALSVLQKGMGLQAAELMKGFRNEEFNDYLEIYFRRYLKTIQKAAKLPLQGLVAAAADEMPSKSFKEKLEAGALFSTYPYKVHVNLNDSDCHNPDLEPEKTHQPIPALENSFDLIACLGGLHHIPKERTEAFVKSLNKTLRPGAVLLLRDHDVTNPHLHAIASVVHSFVNATAGVRWEIESKEVREFQSAEYWTNLLKAHHFTRITPELLILKDDPTQNGMMAFVKEPQTLEELKMAAQYRKDAVRPADGSKATWIEWGNVRYSKQYAAFVQKHHTYAFDHIGHLRQHWTYFSRYIQEARREGAFSLFSDNFAMNLFIFLSTTFQCISGAIASLPSRIAARITKGADWRNATDLTALEQYEAGIEKEYSEYIDQTPFYMFPYLSKVKGLWTTIYNSNEGYWTKFTSSLSAISSTFSLALKAAVCTPIRKLYTQDGQYVEPDQVSLLVHDPQNQIQGKTIYQTPDGHKLLLVPRYRPFTELCKEIASKENVKLIQIGSQPKVTVDVRYQQNESTIDKPLYEMDILQDLEKRRYATYEVDVSELAAFEQRVGIDKIEYVHE